MSAIKMSDRSREVGIYCIKYDWRTIRQRRLHTDTLYEAVGLAASNYAVVSSAPRILSLARVPPRGRMALPPCCVPPQLPPKPVPKLPPRATFRSSRRPPVAHHNPFESSFAGEGSGCPGGPLPAVRGLRAERRAAGRRISKRMPVAAYDRPLGARRCRHVLAAWRSSLSCNFGRTLSRGQNAGARCNGKRCCCHLCETSSAFCQDASEHDAECQ
jgi:hypothetical protein